MAESPEYFTYEACDDSDDLYQGDILGPKKELQDVLRQVHPHFTDSKYTHFVVLTQTCDLVRRNHQPCKSSYINIAVVRPLEDVLLTFLDRCCHNHLLAPGIYKADAKNAAIAFLQRLLDQNEQAMGLFYLHPDSALGIAVPSVIMLQVSIAVRASEHYAALANTRVGRLRGDFRDKLGWLTGNLYARVATQDMDENIRDPLIKELISPNPQSTSPRWISKKDLQRMQASASKPLESLTPQDIDDLLQKHKSPSSQNIAIERVEVALRKVLHDISSEDIRLVTHTLYNDPRFEAAFK